MRGFRRLAHRALALTLAVLSTATLAQGDLSRAEIRTDKLSDTLYVLRGPGGNIGLSVGDDAVFMIDDQYAPLVPKIKAAVAAITPKPVQFVLNTHHHFDHTGGNEAFGREGAWIVAHETVRRRLSTDQMITFLGRGTPQPASPKAALPVITVTADLSFHINGDELRVFHVPAAHTDGDLIVHFKRADVIHMGDVFFNGTYPFIDTGSGGTAEGVVAAFDRVLALSGDKTRIIPGHGPLATRADAQAMRDMLATVIQRIRALRREGRSDDQIRAAGISAEFDERYGKGFVTPPRFAQMMLEAVPR